MPAPKLQQLMSNQEFLDFYDARPDGERWELIDGVPVLMSRPSYSHELITGNIGDALSPLARRRGCRVLRNFLFKVTANDGRMFDPDLMLRCGPPTEDTSRGYCSDALTVFEVLSPSTMGYDRGVKIEAYLRHATLRQAVLVYPGEVRVESWARPEGEAWPEEPLVLRTLGERLPVPALEAEFPMAAIYDGLDLA